MRLTTAPCSAGTVTMSPRASNAARFPVGETDAPEILARCRADQVDATVLVPNCPVCHQTASLVARHLEANGIPTVVMGCAKDIVEHAAVPRFLFSDFPLGNSAGKPHDAASQAFTLELALRVLDAIEDGSDPWLTAQRRKVLDAIIDPFSLRTPQRQLIARSPWWERIDELTAPVARLFTQAHKCVQQKGWAGLARAARRRFAG